MSIIYGKRENCLPLAINYAAAMGNNKNFNYSLEKQYIFIINFLFAIKLFFSYNQVKVRGV